MSDEPQVSYENAYVVDCHDLDKFVNMHLEGYGKTWRSLDTNQDGYHNDSYEEANVAPGQEPDWDDNQDFDRWLAGGLYFGEDTYGGGGGMPSIEEMLQWLCDQDKVSQGKYVVKLWW